MSLEGLVDATTSALFEIERFISSHGSNAILESMKSQMQFIYESASSGKNPLSLVSAEEPFSYRILSSREFSNPEEMKVKRCLDEFSELLDQLPPI